MVMEGKRTRVQRIFLGICLVGLLLIGVVSYRMAVSWRSYSAQDVYSTLSAPNTDEALVILNDDKNRNRICKFNEKGYLTGSCPIPYSHREEDLNGLGVYVGFLNVKQDTAYYYESFTKDNRMVETDFYQIDIPTMTISKCFSVSDFIDTEQVRLYYPENVSFVGSSGGDFGLYLQEGQEEDVPVYRYLRFSQTEDGYEMTQYPVQGSFWKSGFTKMAGAIFVDLTGNIYAPEYGTEPIFLDNGAWIGTENSNYSIYEEGVSFFNLNSGQKQYLSFHDPSQLITQQNSDEEILVDGETYHYADLSNPIRDEEGALSASLLDDGVLSFLYEKHDGSYFRLQTFRESALTIFGMTLLLFLVGAAAEVVVLYGVYRYYQKHGLRVTVFMKILFLMALMAVCMYLAIEHNMNKILTSNAEELSISVAYKAAEKTLEDVPVDALRRYGDITEMMTDQAYYAVNHFSGDDIIMPMPDMNGKLGTTYNNLKSMYVYTDIYLYRNGSVYSLSGNNLVDVEAEHTEEKNFYVAAVKRALASKQMIYERGEDGLVRVIMPVIDRDGAVLGAVQGVAYSTYVDYETEQMIHHMILRLTLLLVGISAVILLMLHVFLQPLKKLKNAVAALAEGKRDVQVEERGYDEIAEIGGTFNRMSRSISDYDRRQEAYRAQYTRFIPEDILYELEKKNILQIQLGDHSTFAAAQLRTTCANFDEVYGQTTDDLFKFINAHLPVQIDIANELGGVVDTMSREGIHAYFRQKPEQAVRAALRMTEFLNHANAAETAAVADVAAISYGSTDIGIVGSGDRLAVENVSHENLLLEQLLEIGRDFGAEVIVTGRYLETLRDPFHAFCIRRLGHVEVLGKEEMLYEFFDSNAPERKRKKWETRTDYEAGVEAYLAGDVQTAHICFAEVLRKDPFDLAARRYFYLCDR